MLTPLRAPTATAANLAFAKYEGLGNDFVLVDAAVPHARCVSLCDRHRGVGADGVLAVLAPTTPGAVATMHITNADGSVPEMCGNGLRCVSLYLVHQGRAQAGVEHVVDTGAGPRCVTVVDDELVRVEMGPAMFTGRNIPTWRDEVVDIGGDAAGAGGPLRVSAVSMGNPHAVLEVPAPTAELATRIGRVLERHPAFPDRTNVELVRVNADASVDVVVWERGVGLTEACGTGACGVAAVLARAGKVPFDADVVVRLPGGPLVVRVPSDAAAPVWMTGPAHRVYRGSVEI